MIKILAIPGSLRLNSSSNLILNEIISFAPANLKIEVFQGVGNLPHFNDAEETPPEVSDFRERVRTSDAVLICTPEYAFGIPGSLKNALDWTVGSGEFIDKPVALITASSQGEKGHAAMILVLTAISAKIIDEASMVISFVRSKLHPAGKIKDVELANSLKKAVQILSVSTTEKNTI
jgi:NAD(P)H-dependent FMN reductase